jgi:hypothetical protein
MLANAALEPLGDEMRILTVPATAEIFLADVPLGRGRWQGRLPIGKHTVSVSDEGYFAAKQILEVAAGRGGDTHIELKVDDKHARWGVRKSGEVTLEAMGGLAIAPKLGSDSETACATAQCMRNTAALGFLAGARLGYEFWFGMSIAAAGGYLRAAKTVERTFGDSFATGSASNPTSVATTYGVTDDIRFADGNEIVRVMQCAHGSHVRSNNDRMSLR